MPIPSDLETRSLRHAAGKLFVLVCFLTVVQVAIIATHLVFGRLLTGGTFFVDRILVIGDAIAIVIASAVTYRLVILPAVRRGDVAIQRFRALYAYNADAVLYYDSSGVLVSSNDAAATLFGTNQPAAGSRIDGCDLFTSSRITEHFARALGGESFQIELPAKGAGDKPLQLIVTLQPVIVENAVNGVYVVAKDITAKRDAEAALEYSEQQFRSIFENHRDAAAAFGPDRKLLRVNRASERLLGYSASEMLHRSGVEFVVDTDGQRARSLAAMDRVFAGESMEWTSNARCKNGNIIRTSVFGVPMIVGGRVVGAFTFVRDVTQEVRLKELLAQHDARIQALHHIAFSTTHEANRQIDEALALGARSFGLGHAFLARVDHDYVVITNAVAEFESFRVGFSMALQRAIARHFYGSDRPLAVADLTQEPWATETARRVLPWRSFIGTTVFLDGSPYGILAFTSTAVRSEPFAQTDLNFIDLLNKLIANVLEHERRETRIKEMVFKDALTGLPNRAVFEEHISSAIAHAGRSDDGVAVHFIDLDGFKPVNDTYGHDAGDDLLRQVAVRLRATVRDCDIVARLGGDEFAILETRISRDYAGDALAGRIKAALSLPFVLPNDARVNVGASLGVAFFPSDAQDAQGLLQKADARMYDAKKLVHRRRARRA